MRIITDGLVIKETNVRDNDRLITVITRDIGVITAVVRGVKSFKSKRGSATSLLAYSNFNFEQKGDTYTVTEASINKMFFGAGTDLIVLSIAQYFCELCNYLKPVQNESEEFLRLILNSLHFLTESNRNPELIKAITELRIAVIAGYAPDLLACQKCGKFEDTVMYFKLDDGSLYCNDCRKENCVSISLTVLKALRHIIYSKFESLYSFEIPDSSAKELSSLCEKYITYQTEHKFTTLDFLRGII
ncbi:MAG: DNA repair protein RecO [Clostridia bacterium]|nr:DNA repair protein RecO [Clostridia bacterium]